MRVARARISGYLKNVDAGLKKWLRDMNQCMYYKFQDRTLSRNHANIIPQGWGSFDGLKHHWVPADPLQIIVLTLKFVWELHSPRIEGISLHFACWFCHLSYSSILLLSSEYLLIFSSKKNYLILKIKKKEKKKALFESFWISYSLLSLLSL